MGYRSLAQTAYERGALQCGEELAALCALLPDPLHTTLEIGCYYGATHDVWSQLSDRVIGVDLGTEAKPPKGVIIGNSHDPQTYERVVAELAGAAVDFLFIDGDHSYDGARADFEIYSPLVRPGGIIAFHDINEDGDPDTEPSASGVGRYWRDLQKTYPTLDIIARRPNTRIPLGIGVVFTEPIWGTEVRPWFMW